MKEIQAANSELLVRQIALILIACLPLSVSQAWQSKNEVSDRDLMEGSKKAILETGISESYFNVHFKLASVVNKTSDHRVMWRFSVGRYVALIRDSIGFYVDGTERVTTHGISQSLGRTTDITKTISRSRALTLMKRCIGGFSSSHVEYGPVDGRAELLLVAESKRNLREREREEAKEREREEKEQRSQATGSVDAIESEAQEKRRPRLIIGYINLQTGKCTKGEGVSTP